MAITNEPLQLDLWNFVWRWIINIHTNSSCRSLYVRIYKEHDEILGTFGKLNAESVN